MSSVVASALNSPSKWLSCLVPSVLNAVGPGWSLWLLGKGQMDKPLSGPSTNLQVLISSDSQFIVFISCSGLDVPCRKDFFFLI